MLEHHREAMDTTRLKSLSCPSRPSSIVLYSSRQIGAGYYSHVFALEDRAYKLFLSGPEVPPRHTKAGRKRVFECQCEAYLIAVNDPWLRRHVAQFYGRCVVENVLDDGGMSVRGNYLLDCCYAVELFAAEKSKVKAREESLLAKIHINEAIQRFTERGINALDADVFDAADPDRFKFIDFEMRDIAWAAE